MAIGFTPKYQIDFPVNDLSNEQFIVIAKKAIENIGCTVSYLSNTGLIAYTNKGAFSRNAEITITRVDAIGTICSESTSGEMVDWGLNKKNAEAFLNKFDTLKNEYTNEELSQMYEALKPSMVSSEDDHLILPPPTKSEQIKGFFSLFIPRKDFYITPLLIDINIVIFILMVVSGVHILTPDGESLLKWGANFRAVTLAGQWWRLITCCFIHIGIIHLLLNMYALMYIGILLEPLLGKARFLSAYLLTGIAASVTSLWWHDLTISAGASGAIFGMYGVFLAMLTTNLIEKTARKSMLTSIAVFVGYNLVYGMKSGIDNAAHIGGLLSGIIVGYSFLPSLRNFHERKLKYTVIGILSLLVLGVSSFVYNNTTNDIGKYDSEMKRFMSMESMALEVQKLPEDAPKDQLLNALNDRGIYYWEENIKLIDDLDKLKLPEELHQRNVKLKRYCQLRIESYNLAIKGLNENNDINKYNSQIEAYNNSIKEILDSFNQ
jgi:rhomboid protease GluP